MRKMLIIIGILSVIFFGMIAYRKLAVKNSTTINAGEVAQIQTYIEKIYLWKEVTEEALPTFNDINQASDKWIWEVVKNNLDDYDILNVYMSKNFFNGSSRIFHLKDTQDHIIPLTIQSMSDLYNGYTHYRLSINGMINVGEEYTLYDE